MAGDLSHLWPDGSIGTAGELLERAAAREDSVGALLDSLEALRSRLERLERVDTVRDGGG